MGIMLPKQGIAKLKHFDASDLETSAFKARENQADESFAHRVGFEQNKSCFECHVVSDQELVATGGHPTGNFELVAGMAGDVSPGGGISPTFKAVRIAQSWYASFMSPETLTDVLERARTRPEEDQQALAEFAHEIEAHRSGTYVMTVEERAAVERGLIQADRGEFASDLEMEVLRNRFGAV